MGRPPTYGPLPISISPLKAGRSSPAVMEERETCTRLDRIGTHSPVPPGSVAAVRMPRSLSARCYARPPAVPTLPSQARTGPHRPVSVEQPGPQSHQEGLGPTAQRTIPHPTPNSYLCPSHSRSRMDKEWTGPVPHSRDMPSSCGHGSQDSGLPLYSRVICSPHLSNCCLDMDSQTQDLPFPTVPGSHHNYPRLRMSTVHLTPLLGGPHSSL